MILDCEATVQIIAQSLCYSRWTINFLKLSVSKGKHTGYRLHCGNAYTECQRLSLPWQTSFMQLSHLHAKHIFKWCLRKQLTAGQSRCGLSFRNCSHYCETTVNPGDPPWPLVSHLLLDVIFAGSSAWCTDKAHSVQFARARKDAPYKRAEPRADTYLRTYFPHSFHCFGTSVPDWKRMSLLFVPQTAQSLR